MDKNKYKNSKHFLLIYYPLDKPCLKCKNVCKGINRANYIPLKSFDTLLEIKKYITSSIFLKISFDAKIFCANQIKVLVGIDSKYLNNSVNTYLIKDFNKTLFTNHGYYFYIEHVIHLEEFIEKETLQKLDHDIKYYSLSNYWQKTYNDIKYL